MQLNQHNPCDMAYCPLTHPCVSILSNIVSDLSTSTCVCVSLRVRVRVHHLRPPILQLNILRLTYRRSCTH